MHKFGHRCNAIWCATLEDTERGRQNAKLIAERDANPPLARIEREDAADQRQPRL
jgi:hypothetical protein